MVHSVMVARASPLLAIFAGSLAEDPEAAYQAAQRAGPDMTQFTSISKLSGMYSTLLALHPPYGSYLSLLD
ncbi:hypothetical protein BPODLACK_02227 [Gordonia sp. YY1]|nr:hypothetical protein BPODLACK_02227 [Gordonia sp. YY1]